VHSAGHFKDKIIVAQPQTVIVPMQTGKVWILRTYLLGENLLRMGKIINVLTGNFYLNVKVVTMWDIMYLF